MTDNSEQQFEVRFRHDVDGVGWARVSHALTHWKELNDGSYRLYVDLVMYAQQKDRCWPGEDLLADDLGVHRTTISRRMACLIDLGLVSRDQRLGTSTVTYIEPLHQCTRLAPVVALMLRRRSTNATLVVAPVLQEQEQEKKNKEQQQRSASVVVFSKTLLTGLGQIGMSDAGVRKLQSAWSEEQTRKALAHVLFKDDIRNPAGYLLKMAGDGHQPADFVPPTAAERAVQETDETEKLNARRCWELDRQPCTTARTGKLHYTWCRFCDVAKIFVAQEKR